MSTLAAYRYEGDGTFTALRRFQADCDRQFTIGEVYRMERREDRSMKSHAHFFAQIDDAYATLSEQYSGRWKNEKHFRKEMLIKADWCDHIRHVCHSKAEAERNRHFATRMDEYAMVVVTGAVVDVYTAKSQAMTAMDRRAFQEVKDRVFGILDDMLGVAKGDTKQHAAEAA